MVDGAGTEVVLISSSPEVLAHHSPPDTTRKDESLSFPFDSLSLCAHRYCQHYTRWNILSLGFRFYLFLSFPLSFFSHLSHRRDFENLSLPPLIDEQFEVFFSLSLSLYLVTKGGKNKPVSFMKILSLESRYSR